MDVLSAMFHNKILIAASASWAVAQVIKTLLHMIVNREFRAERLIGAGGMPSCHSATVCALATSAGVVCGVDSAAFAISVMFAIVTMYDAMGVRYETGKQAQVINDMITYFIGIGENFADMSPEERLKEFIGHTPMQVLMGAMIGICMALLICFV